MNNPLRDTPAEITDKLTRWGGKNEFNLPNWRMILAENHLVQRAGVWTEFEEDTEQVRFEHLRSEDGSLVRTESRQIQPTSVLKGVFWVPLYPCTGWILERWFPPAIFGSRREWESALSQDGETPMMGPFPERGDYFMVDGMGSPWEKIPPLEMVRAGIAQWENSTEHSHGRIDPERLARAVGNAEAAATDREEGVYRALLAETEYAVRNNLSFIKANPTLSAFRNRIAQREGISDHI